MKQTTFDFMKHSVQAEKAALEALEASMDREVFEGALQAILDSDLVVISACGSIFLI